MTISRTLISLADLHYECGLIGISEYSERQAVAHWLDDGERVSADPRSDAEGGDFNADEPDKNEALNSGQNGPRSSSNDDDDTLYFIWFSWVFTRQDEDSYPSTPHGHLLDPNRRWPKLNPYTGRVFKAKEQEDAQLRLGKKPMRLLWRDQRFREFCRSHIVWYMESHPYYDFPVRHPFRFPRPWRKR